MNLKLSELKSNVFKTIEPLFLKQGYKSKKSDFSFTKRTGKNKVQVGFDFLNYYPVNYAFNYACLIWINEIEAITKDFYKYADITKPLLWSASCFEGDFVDEVKKQEYRYRTAFVNEVYSLQDEKKVINVVLERIEKNTLPFLESISTLKGFQDYYLKKYSILSINLPNELLVLSVLLAALLKSEQEFKMLYSFLGEELKTKQQEGVNYSNLFELFGKLHQFSLHYLSAVQNAKY